MRIDLSAAPYRVDDLLRFLRQRGYVAREVEYGVIEVDDGAFPEDHFGVAVVMLSLRVRVWNSVNETDARIVELTEPLEAEAS